ncbi:MAG TPA: HupE/UreJ family protein [Nannocystis sp.]
MFTPRPALAHEVGLSRGVYVVEGEVVAAELTFARDELRGIAPALDTDGDGTLSGPELAAGTGALQVVVTGVQVAGDGQECSGAVVDAALTEGDGARMHLRYACPAAPRRLELNMPLLATLASGHRHLAEVRRPATDAAPEGVRLAEPVLHSRSATASVELGEPTAPSRPPVSAYFLIGVEHILIGIDHLVFLLGLVVIGGRLRSLIAVITAFTIGHSLSLALATLGIWTPDPGFVEPAIALSIAYVGIENFLKADAGGRWRITLPFGFVHGFGFAGVLAEIGVPDDAIVSALLLFNLGVEAGQLLVLALVLPLLALLGKSPAYQRVRGPRWISAAIVIAGLYWFVERVLG